MGTLKWQFITLRSCWCATVTIKKKKNLWFALFALFLNNVKLIVLLFFIANVPHDWILCRILVIRTVVCRWCSPGGLPSVPNLCILAFLFWWHSNYHKWNHLRLVNLPNSTTIKIFLFNISHKGRNQWVHICTQLHCYNTCINKLPYNFQLQYTRHLFATVFEEHCKRIIALLCISDYCHSIAIRCHNIMLTLIWSCHLQLSLTHLAAGQGHSCARLCWRSSIRIHLTCWVIFG